MAKGATKASSFDDFTADNNLLDDSNDFDQEVDEQDEEVEEIEEVEEPKKKVLPKKKVEEVKPTEPEKKVVKKKVEEAEPEEVEEIEEEEETELASEDEVEGPEDSAKFFEEVEKLTGQTVDVDYGDVDPLTPQGIALREKALKESTLDTFLEEMEQKFPQAFKALQHAYNGGDVAELFTQTTGRDYSKVELKEGDDALAKEILKDYYKARGVKSDARIAKLLEAAEDSEEGLVKEAQTAVAELAEEQAEELQEILEGQKQKAAEQKKKDTLLISAVDEVLDSKKLGSFRITDKTEASAFRKQVVQNIRRGADGQYELVTPLETSNLEKILQYQYFQFKQGDLSKIIQQKAVTENTKRLKLKLQGEQDKVKKTTIGGQNEKLSLNSFNAE